MYSLTSFSILAAVTFTTVAARFSSRDEGAVRLITTFPDDSFIENMAVRPTGELVATVPTQHSVFQVDPADPDQVPQLVHDFGNLRPIGISVTTPQSDTFAVATTDDNGSTPNWFLWTVNMTTFTDSTSAIVKPLGPVPGAGFLNGITHLFPVINPSVLIADSSRGAVWLLDTVHPEDIRIVLDDALMQPNGESNTGVGINGLHLFNGTDLYFTNTDQALVGIIPISPDGTAVATGPARLLAKTPPPNDFSLHGTGDVYVDAAPDQLVFVTQEGETRILATNDTLAGITASKFGNREDDTNILYVCTNQQAPAPGNGTVGRIFAVDVDEL